MSFTNPKRTRICGPQSKNGCFTCKGRRIKCDEEKPSCLRCARSGRVCEGYLDRAGDVVLAIHVAKENGGDFSSKHSLQIISEPSRALTVGCAQNARQHYLAQRGVNLLSYESFSRFGGAGTVFDTLLPQLCLTIPAIHTAATALGAVHQSYAAYDSYYPAEEAFAASQYQKALRIMQRDLFRQPDGPIPLIMMCFLLSTTEILLQQEANALLHLRAASRLLKIRRNTQISSHLSRCDNFNTDLHSIENKIEIILRAVGFQICSYAPINPPDLPAVFLPPVLPSITNLGIAHISLVQLVHTCYTFANAIYKFKYQIKSANPSIFIEQGRHIAHLSNWLEQFNSVILPTLHISPADPLKSRKYYHALILRMTALSSLIHLCCVLDPYESAFGTHAQHFQQIVIDGEAVISGRNIENARASEGTDDHWFTTGPGLVQPLFFTAFKCRHPSFRRRAISLLSIAGCEGPWSGPREARITARIMELEEMWSRNSSVVLKKLLNTVEGDAKAGDDFEDPMLILSFATPTLAGTADFDSSTAATDIPETSQAPTSNESFSDARGTIPDRANSISILEMPESALINNMGMNSNGEPSNHVRVRFSKCHNMEAMLSYPCGHGRGQAMSLEPHMSGLCPNNPHWDLWEEMLEF